MNLKNNPKIVWTLLFLSGVIAGWLLGRSPDWTWVLDQRDGSVFQLTYSINHDPRLWFIARPAPDAEGRRKSHDEWMAYLASQRQANK